MGLHGSLLPADMSNPPAGLAEHSLAPSPGQATVLVIDDNAVNRKILVTLMNYEGYRVVEASDGREGLEFARALQPALVISDIVMPTMDGYQFVRQLRADPDLAHIEVIFYTAHYHVREAQQLAAACQVARVLTKPSAPAEILNAVEQVLSAQQGRTPPLTNTAAFDREHLELVTNKLAEKADELQAANGRLHALTELNLQLASERDLHGLLNKMCYGARKLLCAKYAVLLVADKQESGALFIAISGIESSAELPQLPYPHEDPGPIGRVYATRTAWRSVQGEVTSHVLPAGFPPAQAMLVVPIYSASHTYGWLCLADKAGAKEFAAEDERLLAILAAQAGRVYESGSLHRDLQMHAAQLQIEIEERELANAALRHLNRVHALVSGINSLIVRVNTQDELFAEACRLAVNHGDFTLAWIGCVDVAGGTIVPVACAGEGSSIADAVQSRRALRFADDRFIEAAIRSGKPQICSDPAGAVAEVLFDADMRERGCRSLVVLPLVHQDRPLACMILATHRRESLDEAEMRLLGDLADDISFALDHIDKSSQLSYLAYYDSLTGFANRTLFLERLAQSIGAATRSGTQFLVVIADLERFDTVNETYGRKNGDALLKEIAERFSACIGDPNSVARVGPDHFAAIIPFKGEAEVIIAAFEQRYQAWLGAPFRVDDTELRISARSGIALFPYDGVEADVLLRSAVAALKLAKTSGDKFVFFTKEISEKVAERLALETQLRRAVANQEFVLHYQPKVDLETRAVVGVEALMRWASPQLGLVSPAKFIGILEETGLIVETGAWALRRALEDREEWLRRGLDAPRIAVNVSSVQVRKADFLSVLLSALTPPTSPAPATIHGRPNLGRAGIDLEVTESLLLERAEANIEKMKEIRALGVGIAIDDFGTGYSSLSYLARLPVSSLKIDRSFTATMLDDPGVMTLVSTMITLAHSLKLKVIAEGVELEEQAKILRLLRCDQMQGYLTGRPMSFEAMTEYLTANPPRAPSAG
jgi:diguanylate cyclase (GGDEF)-like protein